MAKKSRKILTFVNIPLSSQTSAPPLPRISTPFGTSLSPSWPLSKLPPSYLLFQPAAAATAYPHPPYLTPGHSPLPKK